jgi:hypothetical protein
VRTWNKWLVSGVAVVLVTVGVGMFADDALEGRPPVAEGQLASAELRMPVGETVEGSCADRALLFCEDFDQLPLGEASSADWAVDLEKGTLTVEQDTPAGGSTSTNQVLHARTDDNGRARLVVTDFAAPGNSFFGRARIRVDALPTAPDFAHWVFVEATGPEQGSEIVRPLGGQFIPVEGGQGENRLGIGSDGGPTGDWTDHRESAPAAEGKFQCFEWEMQAQDNRIAVWIDGVANPELTVSTKQHGGNPVDFVFPTFDKVAFGWQLFQAGSTPPSFDILLDDLALSTDRIGC